MNVKIIYRLLMLMAISFSLHSCINEEIYSSSNSSPTEYQNKSLWKEDEKYITNVIKVYNKYASESKINAQYGVISWDYAMTFEKFDESYLVVPVVKNNKVNYILEVKQREGKVFFKFLADKTEGNEFFQALVFSDSKKIKPDVNGNDIHSKGIICRTITITVGVVEGANGEQVPITKRQTFCKITEDPTEISDCLEDPDPVTGECGGAGGGWYPYEDGEPEEENPCEKIKTSLTDPDLINTITELENPNNFTLNHERMFIEQNGVFTELPSTDCQDSFYRPSNPNCITTMAHTHQNVRCDGSKVQSIPSEADIAGLLYEIAGNCSGNYSDIHSFTISQGGTYVLNYSGTNQPNTGFNFDVWSELYEIGIEKLIENKTFTAADQEAFLTNFLKDVVNIDGLEVYKKEGNVIKKLEYNPTTNTATATPCPN